MYIDHTGRVAMRRNGYAIRTRDATIYTAYGISSPLVSVTLAPRGCMQCDRWPCGGAFADRAHLRATPVNVTWLCFSISVRNVFLKYSNVKKKKQTIYTAACTAHTSSRGAVHGHQERRRRRKNCGLGTSNETTSTVVRNDNIGVINSFEFAVFLRFPITSRPVRQTSLPRTTGAIGIRKINEMK